MRSLHLSVFNSSSVIAFILIPYKSYILRID
nr:MAG TPA: hypothetical protein [Bacteriophage sp.]